MNHKLKWLQEWHELRASVSRLEHELAERALRLPRQLQAHVNMKQFSNLGQADAKAYREELRQLVSLRRNELETLAYDERASHARNELATIGEDLCVQQDTLEKSLEFVTKAWLRDVKRRRPKLDEGDGEGNGDGNIDGTSLAVDANTKHELSQKLRDVSRDFERRSSGIEVQFERFCEESGIPKRLLIMDLRRCDGWNEIG